MNWYKKAQQDYWLKDTEIDWESIKLAGIWNWNRFVAYFGMGTILGYAAMVGAANISELQKLFNKNPEAIIRDISQNKERITSNDQNKQIPQSVPNQILPKTQSPDFDLPSENIKSMIERHEGRRHKVYIDTKGIPTVGIGFNLRRNNAKQMLQSVGARFGDILHGLPLTDDQIDQLFQKDLIVAKHDAIKFLPNLTEYPEDIQNIVIDMAFNMGYPTLSQFTEFKKALLNKDYGKAAEQMVNSKWYFQVGNRSRELVDLMRKNAK